MSGGTGGGGDEIPDRFVLQCAIAAIYTYLLSMDYMKVYRPSGFFVFSSIKPTKGVSISKWAIDANML